MSKRARMSLASLSGAAKSNIIQSLGTLAKNCNDLFCCSGEIDKPATIVYKSNELWNAAYFPSDNEDAMLSGLMEASSLASFGVGGETVTDVTYRDARKLEPENFLTSIQLSGMSILPLVLKMLVPNMRTIRAELYKLNIYGPGGHFKPHVDTPRSADMFGSLVVCLPTRFTGGSLVLRHRKQEVIYDWSSTPDHPARTIKWAAFFSNIEHEILPVTSGHRVTLTYNLYREGSEMLVPALSLSSPETTAFKKFFIGALSNPHFMRTGGILGFFCQHSYVFESLNDQKLLPSMLKGGDYSVFVDIKSLGIPIVVKPYLSKGVMLDLFGNDIIEGCVIEWCQIKEQHSYWKLAGAVSSVLTYVNYSCLDSYYQAAAIYVGIPKWGKCRQKLAGRTEEGNAGNEGDKEEVMEEGNKKGELDDGNEDGHNDEADNDTVFMKIFGD
ncbi:hypothetical protein EMCRGX_G012866 [Ephydatia muelleri]